MELVDKYGAQNWTQIAQSLGGRWASLWTSVEQQLLFCLRALSVVLRNWGFVLNMYLNLYS